MFSNALRARSRSSSIADIRQRLQDVMRSIDDTLQRDDAALPPPSEIATSSSSPPHHQQSASDEFSARTPQAASVTQGINANDKDSHFSPTYGSEGLYEAAGDDQHDSSLTTADNGNMDQANNNNNFSATSMGTPWSHSPSPVLRPDVNASMPVVEQSMHQARTSMHSFLRGNNGREIQGSSLQAGDKTAATPSRLPPSPQTQYCRNCLDADQTNTTGDSSSTTVQLRKPPPLPPSSTTTATAMATVNTTTPSGNKVMTDRDGVVKSPLRLTASLERRKHEIERERVESERLLALLENRYESEMQDVQGSRMEPLVRAPVASFAPYTRSSASMAQVHGLLQETPIAASRNHSALMGANSASSQRRSSPLIQRRTPVPRASTPRDGWKHFHQMVARQQLDEDVVERLSASEMRDLLRQLVQDASATSLPAGRNSPRRSSPHLASKHDVLVAVDAPGGNRSTNTHPSEKRRTPPQPPVSQSPERGTSSRASTPEQVSAHSSDWGDDLVPDRAVRHPADVDHTHNPLGDYEGANRYAAGPSSSPPPRYAGDREGDGNVRTASMVSSMSPERIDAIRSERLYVSPTRKGRFVCDSPMEGIGPKNRDSPPPSVSSRRSPIPQRRTPVDTRKKATAATQEAHDSKSAPLVGRMQWQAERVLTERGIPVDVHLAGRKVPTVVRLCRQKGELQFLLEKLVPPTPPPTPPPPPPPPATPAPATVPASKARVLMPPASSMQQGRPSSVSPQRRAAAPPYQHIQGHPPASSARAPPPPPVGAARPNSAAPLALTHVKRPIPIPHGKQAMIPIGRPGPGAVPGPYPGPRAAQMSPGAMRPTPTRSGPSPMRQQPHPVGAPPLVRMQMVPYPQQAQRQPAAVLTHAGPIAQQRSISPQQHMPLQPRNGLQHPSPQPPPPPPPKPTRVRELHHFPLQYARLYIPNAVVGYERDCGSGGPGSWEDVAGILCGPASLEVLRRYQCLLFAHVTGPRYHPYRVHVIIPEFRRIDNPKEAVLLVLDFRTRADYATFLLATVSAVSGSQLSYGRVLWMLAAQRIHRARALKGLNPFDMEDHFGRERRGSATSLQSARRGSRSRSASVHADGGERRGTSPALGRDRTNCPIETHSLTSFVLSEDDKSLKRVSPGRSILGTTRFAVGSSNASEAEDAGKAEKKKSKTSSSRFGLWSALNPSRSSSAPKKASPTPRKMSAASDQSSRLRFHVPTYA